MPDLYRTRRGYPQAENLDTLDIFCGSRPRNSLSLARDQRLLSLDFIGEVGEMIVSLGAAIAAAASAEQLDVLELALRQARATLIEAIAEFRAIDGSAS
jgi:hypothetical protein